MGEDDFKVSCWESQEEDARNRKGKKQLLLGAGQWIASGRYQVESAGVGGWDWKDRFGISS